MFIKSRILLNDKEYNLCTNNPCSLLEVIEQSGTITDAPCAGMGKCGKCKVMVYGNLQPDDLETELLTESEIKSGIRLACRKRIIPDGITIKIKTGEKPSLRTIYSITPSDIAVAIDLGTTTILISLVNLLDNNLIAVHSVPNPQRIYGADVISRIKSGLDGSTLLKMKYVTVNTIANGIEKLIKDIGIDRDRIRSIYIAGNTTMEHIIAGMDLSGLAKAPYKPAFINMLVLTELKTKLDIKIDDIYLFPLIAGFVGGDTIASILATDMDISEEPVALIDIGTNAEIVVGNRDNIYVSSSPAGPAFEGGQIKHGMRAQDGAIQNIVINDDSISLDVKGNTEPEGISGSGLIRIISELTKSKIITESGELLDPGHIANNLAIRSVHKNGEQAFMLYRSLNNEVYLYQSDIRALQLAKSGIAAGLKTLITRSGIKPSKLFLAGAFGNYLNPEDLVLIGMLPLSLASKTYFIGDSVISGLKRFILNEPEVDIEKLLSKIKHIELAQEPSFNKEFISMLELKPTNYI